MPLICSFLVPFYRLYIILPHTSASFIAQPQIKLGIGITCCSNPGITVQGFFIVLWYTSAGTIHKAKIILRIHYTLLSCALVPFNCLSIILRSAGTIGQTQRGQILRLCMPLFCRAFEPLKRSSFICRTQCILAEQRTQPELGLHISGFGGLLKQKRRPYFIGFNAPPFAQMHCKVIACCRILPVARCFKRRYGFAVIVTNATPNRTADTLFPLRHSQALRWRCAG